MQWVEFSETCPEIAVVARTRFARDQLVMVGTLRADGWPRISPCEIDMAAGRLFLGMMWQSTKARDLLRDPRLTIHSVTCNKDGTDGDVKLYGRATDVQDPSLRSAFRDAIRARIDSVPEEPSYHLFSVDIDRAAYVVFGDGQQHVMAWEPKTGFRQWSKRS